MPGYRAWGVSALLVCSACSGDDFTSGSGNTGGQSAGGQTSGGSGGVIGGSGGTSTGGMAGTVVSGGSGGEAGGPPPVGGAAGVPGAAGSGGGGPVACDYATKNCPSGMYCEAPGCSAGTCKPKQADEDGSYQPVCGCNGITYWNESVAAHAGESTKDVGACTLTTAQKCPNGICPGISKCGKSILNQAACGGVELLASCWTLPAGCTGAGEPKAFGCENGCMSKCELIALQDEYFNEGCN